MGSSITVHLYLPPGATIFSGSWKRVRICPPVADNVHVDFGACSNISCLPHSGSDRAKSIEKSSEISAVQIFESHCSGYPPVLILRPRRRGRVERFEWFQGAVLVSLCLLNSSCGKIILDCSAIQDMTANTNLATRGDKTFPIGSQAITGSSALTIY